MRINPIITNNNYVDYSNLNKCRKPCGSISNSLGKYDTFENSKNGQNSLKQNLSFGWINLLDRRRIKNAIGEKYYKPLLDSNYFEVEYKRKFPGMVHVIHVKPEVLSDGPNDQKAIRKIQKTFIQNHSDRFSMDNFKRTGFVCHGADDLIMISTLAKKLKPYEVDPERKEDWVHDHGYVE